MQTCDHVMKVVNLDMIDGADLMYVIDWWKDVQ